MLFSGRCLENKPSNLPEPLLLLLAADEIQWQVLKGKYKPCEMLEYP